MTEQQTALHQRPIAHREQRAASPSVDDPVLARILGARGVSGREDASLSLRNLLRPSALTGLDEAVDLMAQAVQVAEARTVIVGDFDADGATATALAKLVLTAMGAHNVFHFVPNRFEFGYGLTPRAVEIAAEQMQPDLIITVDNGISSVDGVHLANELGISVVITDHHLPPDELPTADAIVNPNLKGDGFKSKNLAGVGVMFYVLSALRQRLVEEGWFDEIGIEKPNLADYLDLVALGTVADVVQFDPNNRILVAEGLKRIAAGRCRPGITALLEAGGRNPQKLTASDLGFAVAPRLNAAGRLEDMSVGIECLLADNLDEARTHAKALDELNRERRKIESTMQDDARLAVEQLEADTESGMPQGLCLFDASWHHGVVGLVAARIRERFDRPTVAFAPASETELKGSGRSVHGLHLRDLFEHIALQNPGLLDKFGGHAMAAGLSLHPDKFPAFKTAFEQAVRDELGEDHSPGTLITDGTLSSAYLNVAFATALQEAGPWGPGFDEPLFDGQFDVAESRIVGQDHVKLSLIDPDTGRCHDGIAFRFGDRFEAIQNAQRLHVVYRLEVNEFRGERKPQLNITHMHAC